MHTHASNSLALMEAMHAQIPANLSGGVEQEEWQQAVQQSAMGKESGSAEMVEHYKARISGLSDTAQLLGVEGATVMTPAGGSIQIPDAQDPITYDVDMNVGM